jgi:radical SAM-linked protein
MSKQPPQQPPPVQRLRVQYAKRGRLRFTSHRDFSRAFERALVRARVPMAYSSGFNPHPRISYAGAAPTGSASEAEYLEIAMAQVCDPEEVRQALDEALPAGLDILRVQQAGPGALADQLTASKWVVTIGDVDQAALSRAVADFLAETTIEVERMTKKGPRQVDVRAAVVSLVHDEQLGSLELILRHQTPTVRPGDVLTAMGEQSGLSFASAVHTRLEQGQLVDGDRISDPLEDHQH